MHIHELGTVVATADGPTPLEFDFVISNPDARNTIESGLFVQIEQNGVILAVITSLRRTNRYFSSPDLIHGSTQGMAVNSIYPVSAWDYLIGRVKVLGKIVQKRKIRSTQPVLPGSKVYLAESGLLRKFLGIDLNGLHIGQIRQSEIDAQINIDKLLQKHLAILSISGGGKSYTTSVLIEEVLKRNPGEGRPALVLFDVHGEYSELTQITENPNFNNAEVIKINSDSITLGLGHFAVGDYGKIFPSMTNAQKRELGLIISKLKQSNIPISVDMVIRSVIETEMNPLIKEALAGWLNQLRNTYLFSNVESPSLNKELQAGRLVIINMENITSLWKKRVIVHYFLSRMFEMRKSKQIPPVVSFLEEAHQFAPEVEASSSKAIIHTIAREGRKFLCSLVLISQRPINLSTTALSQCNSHLILRILNPYDLNYIGKTSEGINQETLQMLTSLGVGEALLVGEAINYPIFVQIREKIVAAKFDHTSLANESRRYEKQKINQF